MFRPYRPRPSARHPASPQRRPPAQMKSSQKLSRLTLPSIPVRRPEPVLAIKWRLQQQDWLEFRRIELKDGDCVLCLLGCSSTHLGDGLAERHPNGVHHITYRQHTPLFSQRFSYVRPEPCLGKLIFFWSKNGSRKARFRTDPTARRPHRLQVAKLRAPSGERARDGSDAALGGDDALRARLDVCLRSCVHSNQSATHRTASSQVRSRQVKQSTRSLHTIVTIIARQRERHRERPESFPVGE
eukprot:COSAG06_NODE_10418_length_1684_cov_2.248580_2_plen_242_part_00